MADNEDKNPENVKGLFYVDSQCIDCDLCREQCIEAMEGCPVEAIGEDGE